MNILINFSKAKAGGGKYILDNFVNSLLLINTLHKYYILIPASSELINNYNTKFVSLIKLPKVFDKNILFLLLYYYKIKKLCSLYKIDVVLNFGDVIVPAFKKQVYFFDWAYAVYDEKYIWSRMNFNEFLIRKTKVFLIKREIGKIAKVVVQTNNMATRLKAIYGLTQVDVLPTPFKLFSAEVLRQSINVNYLLPTNKKLFLVPSGYASHKNLEVLIEVAKLIKKTGLPYVIILTIGRNKQSQKFLDLAETIGAEYILNIGKQEHSQMGNLYKSSNAMLLPTLIESFGIPYVEAMSLGVPILTSDLDFAHDVCGNAASYFDPFNAKDILNKMRDIVNNPLDTENRISNGFEKINFLPDWKQTVKEFESKLEEV